MLLLLVFSQFVAVMHTLVVHPYFFCFDQLSGLYPCLFNRQTYLQIIHSKEQSKFPAETLCSSFFVIDNLCKRVSVPNKLVSEPGWVLYWAIERSEQWRQMLFRLLSLSFQSSMERSTNFGALR